MNLRPIFYTVSQQDEAGGVLLSVYQPVLGGGGAGWEEPDLWCLQISMV